MPFAAAAKHLADRSHEGLRRRRKDTAAVTKGHHHGHDVVIPVQQVLLPNLTEVDISSSSWSHEGSDEEVDILKEPKLGIQKHLIKDIIKNPPVSHEEEDTTSDDSSSVSSIESLLSARSEDADLSSLSDNDIRGHRNNALKGIERLEQELELRKRRLVELCSKESPSCVCVLKANEDAAGALKMKQYLSKHSQKKPGKANDHTATPLKPKQPAEPHSPIKMWRWLVFEGHHAIPASVKLVVICCCHLFVHGVVETGSKILYHSVFLHLVTQKVFYLCEVMMGLCLLRANGYLWCFLDDKAYNVVKFDMHNRMRLSRWDAKMLSFFKTTIFGSAANLFGFYLVYIGLNQLTVMPYNNAMKDLDAWYLSTKESLIEENDFDEDSLTFYSWEGLSPGYSEAASRTCELLKQYVRPGYLQQLFDYCCTDPFQEWKGVEVAYHGMGLLVVTVFAAYLGVNILEICDEE